jgi:dTDP-4-amino-4,6-dideoxygalactose transaminase
VANGFIQTVEAIVLLGAVPVFVDVDAETYTMNPARLVAAIRPRTRAIVPVHLHGQMADMRSIMSIAQQHGLAVVEDASEAHGAADCGRRAGSIGDGAAFSLGLSHNLGAYGQGGAVTTSSRAIAECVQALREHGLVDGHEHSALKRHKHQELGVNSHLDELQAAALRVKLRYLDAWNEQRRKHAETYGQLLENFDCIRPIVRRGASHVFHRYVVQTAERDDICRALADRGVSTAVHYPVPIHKQLVPLGLGRVSGDLRITEALSRRVLSLPMYPQLEQEQISYVASCLREHIGLLGRV